MVIRRGKRVVPIHRSTKGVREISPDLAKTARLSLRISQRDKDALYALAERLGMSPTNLVERVANLEPPFGVLSVTSEPLDASSIPELIAQYWEYLVSYPTLDLRHLTALKNGKQQASDLDLCRIALALGVTEQSVRRIAGTEK